MENKWKQLDEKGWKRAVHIRSKAAKLFHKKGYLETSMGDIAASVRMSKGGVYHYFSSKDEILFFVLNSYMDVLLKDLEQDLEEIEDRVEKIRFIIARHLRIFTTYPSESKTLFHEVHALPSKFFNLVAEKERKYYQIIADVLSEYFENRVERHRLTGMTFVLLGMCNWTYSWYNPKGPLDPQELSNLIFNIFLNGLDSNNGGPDFNADRREGK